MLSCCYVEIKEIHFCFHEITGMKNHVINFALEYPPLAQLVNQME